MTTIQIATKTFENLARNIAITSGIVAEQSKHDIRCIIDDCRVFWQVIDSEEAHFIYAFIGVAIGWLAIQTIKMGMAARTWCDRNGHTEQVTEAVEPVIARVQYSFKRCIRIERMFLAAAQWAITSTLQVVQPGQLTRKPAQVLGGRL